ncbi:MAG: T9SS type A sorting domain-containing protein [Bacteroidales bacterium]
MRKKILILNAILLMCSISLKLHAQETVLSSGGNISGNDGSISYSIGQTFCTTQSGTNGLIIQGVQQPYEISVVSGIAESGLNLSCKAYPNPTTNILILSIDAVTVDKIQSLSYLLYDISGKIIMSNKIDDYKTTLPVNDLKSGVYILKVIQENKQVKTFKIIKN